MTAGWRSEAAWRTVTTRRAMTAGWRRVAAGGWCVTARGGIPAALSHDTSSLKNSKPTRRVTEASRPKDVSGLWPKISPPRENGAQGA